MSRRSTKTATTTAQLSLWDDLETVNRRPAAAPAAVASAQTYKRSELARARIRALLTEPRVPAADPMR